MEKFRVIFHDYPNHPTSHLTAMVFAYHRSFDLELGSPYTFGKEWDTIVIYGRRYSVDSIRMWGIHKEVMLRLVSYDQRRLFQDAREHGHRWTRATCFVRT